MSFSFSRNPTFDEASESIQRANEQLRRDLITLRNVSGSDASLEELYWGARGAELGTLPDVIVTLMACVDALSARVAILENQ